MGKEVVATLSMNKILNTQNTDTQLAPMIITISQNISPEQNRLTCNKRKDTTLKKENLPDKIESPKHI